jgi:serine/threonine protein kinase
MVRDKAREPYRAWFSAEDLAGSLVHDRYRLGGVIGSGGAAVVFEAIDEHSGRPVALKLYRQQRTDVEAFRVLREVGVTGTLNHPHIVELLDWGSFENRFPFLVLELLSGHTLEAERAARGVIAPADALALILPIMGAVAYAHEQGVLHRDLKTQNIFLACDAQGRCVPKLLDFGVAKAVDESSLTRSGTILGTPAFMSPEQALDEPLDVRTDVWSIGVVLYAVLTGNLPFAGESHTRTLLELVSAPAPSLSAPRALPPQLCLAVDKALERSRDRRHQDMPAFARALKIAALEDGIALPDDPEPRGLPEWSRWTADQTERARDWDAVQLPDGNAIGRYKSCFMCVFRAGTPESSLVASFEYARRMQARCGPLSLLVVVESKTELPNSKTMGEIMRFYDEFRFRAVASVLEARGVVGKTHRAIMSTVHFVRRRDYPGKVFATTDQAVAWLARSMAEPNEIADSERGLSEALVRVRA